jgi:hypothetical protein
MLKNESNRGSLLALLQTSQAPQLLQAMAVGGVGAPKFSCWDHHLKTSQLGAHSANVTLR